MVANSIPTQLHQDLLSLTVDYINRANQYFNRSFPIPVLSFKLRGQNAGTAHLQTWSIRLNPVLMLDNQDEFKQQVLPHEIAHLITFAVFGRVRPHGQEWQSVMQRVFHLRAERTHKMDVSKVTGPRFSYHCQCQSYELSLQRHRKVIQGKARYYCKKCGQLLTPSQVH